MGVRSGEAFGQPHVGVEGPHGVGEDVHEIQGSPIGGQAGLTKIGGAAHADRAVGTIRRQGRTVRHGMTRGSRIYQVWPPSMVLINARWASVW